MCTHQPGLWSCRAAGEPVTLLRHGIVSPGGAGDSGIETHYSLVGRDFSLTPTILMGSSTDRTDGKGYRLPSKKG